MPSTYSASLRVTLQATGENLNTWGGLLNTGSLQLFDFAVAGWTTKALTGNYSLTTASGAADEARSAMLKFTGAGTFTVTIPNVSKRYDVWNATTGVLTVTNGSVSVTLQVGEVVAIITDGSTGMKRVVPTDFGGTAVIGITSLTGISSITGLNDPTSATQAATKNYVDATAFAMTGGVLPGQGGSAGKFLTTNGSAASWGNPNASPTITTPTVTGGTFASPAITSPTITSGMTLSGGATVTGSTKQTVQAVSALDLDLSASDFFTKSISSNSTFTFSNPTASKGQGFVLDLTISSAATTTWPAAVKWAFGAAPVLGNGRHILGFITDDGGTSYVAIVGAQAVA